MSSTTNRIPADLKISGYGIFGNRELKRMVQMLETGKEPLYFDPSFVEDAVVILFSRLARDGYLNPLITTKLLRDDGQELTLRWTEPLQHAIPRPARFKRVTVRIHHRTLFYFDRLTFHGLETISREDARHFFIETDAPLVLKRNKVFSPNRLHAGLNNLSEALERQGYESASVTETNLTITTNTGAVSVDIIVNQGPKSLVRVIRTDVIPADTNSPVRSTVILTNSVFSQNWLQDWVQANRRRHYSRGYADTSVEVEQERRIPEDGLIHIDLLTKVRPGTQVRIGDIRFEGNKETHESLLRRKVRIAQGDLLDPAKAEQGRYRLARLGAFDSVELGYEPVDEDTRDVIYQVREGKQLEFSLLAGYGSYEQLRGGFDLEQYNLWGRAHRSHLRAIQSFKASSANYLYTIPQVAGDDTDFFLHANGLRREELEFTREEFGGGAGARRFFPGLGSDLALRYNYQVLNAADLEVSEVDGLASANVGSFVIDLKHDARDNPLVPRSGYKIFSSLELASAVLAGDVDYQRFETTASYHRGVGNGRWVHLGFSHGFITTENGPAIDLPFNRRFFPGGENSIRGYQFGEAAPRNEEGKLVGAETFMLGNVEFEQSITRALSFVLFVDALGAARRLDDYPFDETLYSAGGGLRWKTIIGPARLEYGYNLNPRNEDPTGTLHFSIGFPF